MFGPWHTRDTICSALQNYRLLEATTIPIYGERGWDAGLRRYGDAGLPTEAERSEAQVGMRRRKRIEAMNETPSS